MMAVASKLRRSLHERGVAETARLTLAISLHKVVTSIADKRIDRLLGADTFGVIPSEELGLQEPGFGYEPTAGHILELSLRALKLDFATYSFVDLGAGKGRTLFYASRHPFRQVVGVEFIPMLHKQAQHSVEAILRHTRPSCREIAVHKADAAQFELPMTNLVIFMYNPFGPSVLRAVLQQAQQRARSGFKVYVVYYNPAHRDLLDALDWLEPFRIPLPYHLACRLTSPVPIAFYRPVPPS